MPRPTVLVLGAGSSCSYGYPVGSKLRAMILEMDPDDLGERGETFDAADVRRFQRAFQQSAARSIDTFLGRRTEFDDVGKMAIALSLLRCEPGANFDGPPPSDDWYGYLFNRLAEDDWDHFDPGWLTIVTFNYDRSLEIFLLRALIAMYGKSEEQALSALQRLPIHHVYGCLGTPWASSGASYIRYGQDDDDRLDVHERQAMSRLRVIPEGRDEDESLIPARQALFNAQRIAFLGFSYDPINVRRLGASQVFEQGKWIGGTTLGMTKAEVYAARLAINREHPPHEDFFMAHSCEAYLRETLLFDD